MILPVEHRSCNRVGVPPPQKKKYIWRYMSRTEALSWTHIGIMSRMEPKTPDQSWPNPNQTDPIYAKNTLYWVPEKERLAASPLIGNFW